jgi:hypothetical protein
MFLGLYLVYHIMPDFQGNIPKAALKVALFAGAIILGFCISS